MEDELDSLLSQLDPQELSSHFDLYNDLTYSRESQPCLGFGPSATNEPLPSPCTSGNRFHTLKTDSEVEEARKKAVPKNTDKNTSWAVNIWKQWSAHRRKVCTSFTEWPTHLLYIQYCLYRGCNHWTNQIGLLEVSKSHRHLLGGF